MQKNNKGMIGFEHNLAATVLEAAKNITHQWYHAFFCGGRRKKFVEIFLNPFHIIPFSQLRAVAHNGCLAA